ncbi:MAG: hypothetical protein HC927_09950 [Deltaproteobacteria bacterium]|nr:hypothetical protein [Deltaproteobacteria bacterium]
MTVGITVIGGQVRRAFGPSSASSLSGPPGCAGGGAAFGAEQPDDDDRDQGKDEGKDKGRGKHKHKGKRRRFTRKVRCRSS